MDTDNRYFKTVSSTRYTAGFDIASRISEKNSVIPLSDIDCRRIKKIDEVPAKFGISDKKYDKAHFILIFGKLLVCSQQKQG